jgi:hypothetical protein
VFIFTDDQRHDAAGFAGNQVVHPPNLDALASRGMIFENCLVNTSIYAISRARNASLGRDRETDHLIAEDQPPTICARMDASQRNRKGNDLPIYENEKTKPSFFC